jgi:hypothetical protein
MARICRRSCPSGAGARSTSDDHDRRSPPRGLRDCDKEALDELPKAEKLSELLYEQSRTVPTFDPDAIPDDDWIEDQLWIERARGPVVRRRDRPRAGRARRDKRGLGPIQDRLPSIPSP